ncbi:hypothetical protein M3Y96_01123900 [Aphelenchoides besseyi]|nr:hypothetical protein M3Y96_01123900 [Aphelenchoides besseyi]
MLRPLTTRGGVLEHVYFLWNIYADVDIRYATANDITTMANWSTDDCRDCNGYSRFGYGKLKARKRSRHARLTAFTSTAFVFWKTCVFLMLYVVAMIGMWNMLAVPVVDTENHSSKVALVATTDEETNELSATEPLRSKHRGLNIV